MEIPDRMTENTPQFESTRQPDAKNIVPPQTSTPQKDSPPKVPLNDDKVIEDEDLIEDVHSSELDKMPDDRDLICPETNDVPRDMDENDDDIVLSSGDENFETPKSSPKKLEKGANCSRQLNLESDSDEDKPKLRRKKKQRTPPGLREEKQSDEEFDDDDTTLIGDDLQATITPKVSFLTGTFCIMIIITF